MNRPVDWLRIAELVERAREGDADAFRDLLQDQRDAVVSTLVACGVRSHETAKDLAQDVALRAWNRLPNLRETRAFRAWIRRIAANAARDHLRRLAVRREEGLDAAIDLTAEDDPHQKAERTAELRLMVAALEQEDPEVVELLVARARGVSVEELARSQHLSAAALKMRLVRARKRLRRRLEQLRLGSIE